jgi:hypothetical protein
MGVGTEELYFRGLLTLTKYVSDHYQLELDVTRQGKLEKTIGDTPGNTPHPHERIRQKNFLHFGVQ